MTSVHFDTTLDDDERRAGLFAGDLYVYSPRRATLALVDHARAMLEEAFAPHDPRHVHEVLTAEQCAAVLAEMKPRFIHHPRSKDLVEAMLVDLGCDPDLVHYDVPRMRSSYPSDYLTTGIAYAFPAHRDTWYSAPQCQLNWWLPMYDLRSDNCLSFIPRYFAQGIPNDSDQYNYYRWNATSRGTAAAQVKRDERVLPSARPAADDIDLKVLCPPGGVIVFAAAQLHASVPNSSGVARYSVDFRTVHLDDARAKAGAPNVDVHCTGHTMRDYKSASTRQPLPDDVIAAYDDGTENEGVLVWDAQKAAVSTASNA